MTDTGWEFGGGEAFSCVAFLGGFEPHSSPTASVTPGITVQTRLPVAALLTSFSNLCLHPLGNLLDVLGISDVQQCCVEAGGGHLL